MESRRAIVVGTDFSEGAARALAYAGELAGAFGARIACVHVYEDAPDTPAFHDPAPALRKQIEDFIARSLPSAYELHVDAIVRRGAPWEKLANVATEIGAELIVIGAEGERGVAHRGFVGTVVSRLLSSSPRSVLVVVRSSPRFDRIAS